MEHTKTPWRIFSDTNLPFPIITDSEPVGDTIGLDVGEIFGQYDIAIANARFIVKAVNSHDKLIKGLQDLLDYIDDDDSYRATIIRQGIGELLAELEGE